MGDRIRRLRTEAGYSQEGFAERCGLNRNHIGLIERGQCNVTFQTMKMIADALKLQVKELLP